MNKESLDLHSIRADGQDSGASGGLLAFVGTHFFSFLFHVAASSSFFFLNPDAIEKFIQTTASSLPSVNKVKRIDYATRAIFGHPTPMLIDGKLLLNTYGEERRKESQITFSSVFPSIRLHKKKKLKFSYDETN